MEARGWIARYPHPIHRHVVEAKVTSAGEMVLDQALTVMNQVDTQIAEGLDPAARTALDAALALCLANAQSLLAKH
jgi:DNA-binding MarR family transcriptional regulator